MRITLVKLHILLQRSLKALPRNRATMFRCLSTRTYVHVLTKGGDRQETMTRTPRKSSFPTPMSSTRHVSGRLRVVDKTAEMIAIPSEPITAF